MLWFGCTLLALASGLWLWKHRNTMDPHWWATAWVIPLAAIGLAVACWPGLVHIQKMLGLLLMPAGLLWIALLVLVARWPGRWPGRLILLLLFLGYTAAGNRWLGGAALRALEQPFMTLDPTLGPPLDAVVVLGGGTARDGRGEPQLGEAGDRIRVGAAVYHAGRSPVILATGSGIPGFDGLPGRNLGAETRACLMACRVPATAIQTLPGPANTAEEIAALALLARTRGWTRLGLVTSAWHLPRALALCAAQGLQVEPLPADFRGDRPGDSPAHLVPQGSGFLRVHLALWEWLGRLIGR